MRFTVDDMLTLTHGRSTKADFLGKLSHKCIFSIKSLLMTSTMAKFLSLVATIASLITPESYAFVTYSNHGVARTGGVRLGAKLEGRDIAY